MPKNQKLPKQKEKQVKAAIKQFLDLHGIRHFHVLQGLGCYKGIPDMFAVADKVYAIEVKTATGRQSDYQKKFQDMWEGQGHPYILARGIDDVAKIVQ